MSLKVTGMRELEKQIEQKLGHAKMREIQDEALKDGGQVILKMIKAEQSKYADTGATVNEATLSVPMWIKGERIVKIHWKGSMERYRIIHLQERGFWTKDGSYYNPKSKGALQRVMQRGRAAYFQSVHDRVKREVT